MIADTEFIYKNYYLYPFASVAYVLTLKDRLLLSCSNMYENIAVTAKYFFSLVTRYINTLLVYNYNPERSQKRTT